MMTVRKQMLVWQCDFAGFCMNNKSYASPHINYYSLLVYHWYQCHVCTEEKYQQQLCCESMVDFLPVFGMSAA